MTERPDDHARWRAFIRANTRLLAPPLVPEIRLRLAEESLAIWQKTEEELADMQLPPPFWAFAWAGGQALARYVLDHPETVRGRRVLDLGAGCGLAAIAAMKAGATAAVANDIDPIALAAVAENADANGVVVALASSDVLTSEPPTECSAVLVGDLFYERALADRVLGFLDAIVERGAVVLVGDPKRSYFPVERFTPCATYEVAVSRELEDYEIRKTSVWSMERR